MATERGLVLVTGATGYVGGRLVPRLLEDGWRVRCLAREPRRLEGRWPGVEVVAGDAGDPESLRRALAGCQAAYYLVHAMGGGERGFAERDRAWAAAFRDAAEGASVRRIVYLGGLGRRGQVTSRHLASRHEVGDVLRSGTVPVTELRAAMIVGAGSASFDMLRHLTERLPVMVCPRWVHTRSQPIYVEDALDYLVGALAEPRCAGEILDIGGPEVLTYAEMMLAYAEVRGLRRYIFTVPVLTPRLSAYWVNLVTPVPASIAFPLVEGLRSEMVCENDRALELLPNVRRTPFREAVAASIREAETRHLATKWTGASRGRPAASLDAGPLPERGVLRDRRVVRTRAPLEALERAVLRVGGETGWYYADALWRIRGGLDRLIGGVGLRRGRRDAETLEIGDAVDFWRVEDRAPGRLLLRAEMRLPGRAWLEFRWREAEGGRELEQTAHYLPGGLLGVLYWWALWPLHVFVFGGMARNIVRAAERASGTARKGEAV